MGWLDHYGYHRHLSGNLVAIPIILFRKCRGGVNLYLFICPRRRTSRYATPTDRPNMVVVVVVIESICIENTPSCNCNCGTGGIDTTNYYRWSSVQQHGSNHINRDQFYITITGIAMVRLCRYLRHGGLDRHDTRNYIERRYIWRGRFCRADSWYTILPIPAGRPSSITTDQERVGGREIASEWRIVWRRQRTWPRQHGFDSYIENGDTLHWECQRNSTRGNGQCGRFDSLFSDHWRYTTIWISHDTNTTNTGTPAQWVWFNRYGRIDPNHCTNSRTTIESDTREYDQGQVRCRWENKWQWRPNRQWPKKCESYEWSRNYLSSSIDPTYHTTIVRFLRATPVRGEYTTTENQSRITTTPIHSLVTDHDHSIGHDRLRYDCIASPPR